MAEGKRRNRFEKDVQFLERAALAGEGSFTTRNEGALPERPIVKGIAVLGDLRGKAKRKNRDRKMDRDSRPKRQPSAGRASKAS